MRDRPVGGGALRGIVYGQRPQPPRDVVGIEIAAVELGEIFPAVDVAAGDRLADVVRVLPDRIDESRAGGGVGRCVGLVPFAQAPAVVRPLRAEIDLLPQILSDVGDPQSAGAPIERHPPRVAQAVGPDLLAHAGGARRLAAVLGHHGDEGIVIGDSVGRLLPFGVDVDPQHLAEEVLEVLPVAERIILLAAVAVGDVEIAIGAEADRAPFVVPRRVLDAEDLLAAGCIGRIGIVLRYAVALEDHREGRRLRGVVDEELAVLGEPGMEGEAEEPLFVLLVGVVDLLGEVEEHLRRCRVGAEEMDRPLLLRHEQPPRSITGVRQQDRPQRIRCAIDIGRPAGPDEIGERLNGLDRQRRLIDRPTLCHGRGGSCRSVGGRRGGTPRQEGQREKAKEGLADIGKGGWHGEISAGKGLLQALKRETWQSGKRRGDQGLRPGKLAVCPSSGIGLIDHAANQTYRDGASCGLSAPAPN